MRLIFQDEYGIFRSMEEAGDKQSWGGSRPGAGRPRVVQEPERIGVDFERSDLDALRDLADRRGTSVADLIRRAVGQYVRRAKRG